MASIVGSSRRAKVKSWLRRSSKSSNVLPPVAPSPSRPTSQGAEPCRPQQPALKSQAHQPDSLARSEEDAGGHSIRPVGREDTGLTLVPGPDGGDPSDLWLQAQSRLSDKERSLLLMTSDASDGDAVLSGLHKLAEEKRKATEEKAWRVDFGGRRIVIRDVANKIVMWLNAFKGVGDVIAQCDPVHAGLPWAAIRFILQVAVTNHTQMGLVLVGIEQVTCALTRCKVFERLYLDGVKPTSREQQGVQKDLVESLVRLYSKILAFLAYYIGLMDISTAKRTLRALVLPTVLSDLLSDMGTLEERASNSADVCERQLSHMTLHKADANFEHVRTQLREQRERFDQEMSRFWRKLDDDDRCRVFEWLSSVQYESDHYEARKGRVDGTGDWLLSHTSYSQWRSTGESMLFWLNGIPGAGKTKLSSKVIDDLRSALDNNEQAFAYFYCDRNRADHQDPVAVLRSFIHQLCAPEDNSAIDSHVEAVYNERRRKGFAKGRLTSEECRDLLFRLVEGYEQSTLVIDGLDECDRETRCSLMDILDELVKKSPRLVKVYIASRTDQDLRDRYQAGTCLEVTANDNQADIEKYVLHRMEQSEFCRKKMSKKVRQEVLSTFRKKSLGMFQWATLHIGELLELRRNADILKYLDKLPEGLKATYDEVFGHITAQRGSKKDIALAAFKLVMCSWRPLSPRELVVAVTQNPDADFCVDYDVDLDFVLEACRNLLVVTDGELERRPWGEEGYHYGRNYVRLTVESSTQQQPAHHSDIGPLVNETSICRFAHLSVQEYIDDHLFSQREAHDFMARICLRTLLCLRLASPGTKQVADQGGLGDGDSVCGEGEDDTLVLDVKWRPRKTRFRVTFRDDDDDDDDDDVDDGERDIVFRCYQEFVHVHSHDDGASCISVELDSHINNYRGTRIEKWAMYAAQAFAYHARLVLKDGEDESLTELLLEFLGSPGNASPHYQAWRVLNQANADITAGRDELLNGASAQRFPGALLVPSSDPTLGCAFLGLHQILSSWLEAGLVDIHMESLSETPLLDIAVRGRNHHTCRMLLDKGAKRTQYVLVGEDGSRPQLVLRAVMCATCDIECLDDGCVCALFRDE